MGSDRMASIAQALATVRAKVTAAALKAGRHQPPRLVAVSKTKPLEALIEAFSAGQRTFGENYVQELVDKAPQMPEGAQFHFIGRLQSNKAALIAAVPNLETVDSKKLANKLNQGCVKAGRQDQLNVFVQCNTSGEQSKGGLSEAVQVVELASHVVHQCPQLTFSGLMTIGKPGETSDFEVLRQFREEVCTELKMPTEACELSMGMSNDFEAAVAHGSTNVRVGSSLFGARDYSQA